MERQPGHESSITVAAIQTRALTGDKEGNNERGARGPAPAMRRGRPPGRAARAGQLGLRLQLARRGRRARRACLRRPDDRALGEAARERGATSAAVWPRSTRPVLQQRGARRPDGFVGRYRKAHLWDEEKLFFEPGDLGLNVFDLPFGRVAMMICYDGWHPEVARILKLKGADLILDPTCWVLVPGVVTPENPVSAYVHMATAHVNSLFIVCADQCGVERGCTFIGRSCIAGRRFRRRPGRLRRPREPDCGDQRR